MQGSAYDIMRGKQDRQRVWGCAPGTGEVVHMAGLMVYIVASDGMSYDG